MITESPSGLMLHAGFANRNEAATISLVSAVPSWNFTPRRSRNCHRCTYRDWISIGKLKRPNRILCLISRCSRKHLRPGATSSLHRRNITAPLERGALIVHAVHQVHFSIARREQPERVLLSRNEGRRIKLRHGAELSDRRT